MKSLPSISIITPTWNSNIPLFERVLRVIASQSYPKDLVEHIVIDAGSTNGTAELARRYGCEVIVRSDLKVQEQVRASLCIKKAKHDLVLVLQSDNIPTSNHWLREMVQPFIDHSNVFCTYSAYNDYEENMSATTKYGAFFGTGDPTLYYLGKSDKIPLTQTFYDKGEIKAEYSKYWLVTFTKNTLPTMGDNGQMFLRSAMEKVNKDSKSYVHLDAFMDLVELGYTTCGVVKNSIIHVIPPNISTYAKRRVQVKETFYDGRRGNRKYLVFDWKSSRDRWNIFRFIVASYTFVYPMYESIRGFMIIREAAWFLHPVICFLMAWEYTKSECKWQVSQFKKIKII